MNIKSLILGSAAALVAGGAAQAADLPVAEPVDYVKVCNAYGAGYHFIPGTDTCLKIGGYVRAEFQYDEPQSRNDNTTNIAARTEIHFTAKEETELGTLVGYAKLDSDGTTKFDKYYLSIGGLYAGLTDSAATIDYTDQGFYGAGVGDHDSGVMGYNMDLGNGVTGSIAIENSKRNTIDGNANALNGYAGQSLPDIVAALTVSQGWGALKVAAAVHQIRYDNAAINTDYGYFFGAGLKFNLDMLSAGSNIAFTGGYAKGATAYIAGATTARGIGAAVANDDANIVAGVAKLNTVWELGATLKYAWASNFNTYLSGAYRNFNHESGNNDYKSYNVGLTAEYLPVKNLIVRVGANYSKNDWSAASGNKDVDNWEGKLRLQRNF